MNVREFGGVIAPDDVVPVARTIVRALTPLAAIALLWSAALVHVPKIYEGLHFDHPPCDFCVYYASALALRHGLDPYSTDITSLPLGAEGGIPRATDPPTYLLLFEPLTLLAPKTAFWTWIALNSIALVAALLLLLGPRSGLRLRVAVMLASLALLYPPLDWHFNSAQNKLLILLALVLVLRWMENKCNIAAGLMLALASLLRIFPLLLLGYFGLRRRWTVVAYTVTGLIVGTLVTLLFVGVQPTFGFLHATSFLTAKQWLDLNGNASLVSIVSRLFWDTGHENTLFLRRLSIGFAWLFVLIVTVIATVAGAWEEDPDWRAYSLWLVASVMLSPTAFGYDLVLLFIPFAQLASAASRSRASARAIWATVISYLLIRNPDLLKQLCYAIGSPRASSAVIIESRFFGLLSAYIATFWLLIDWSPTHELRGRGTATARGEEPA